MQFSSEEELEEVGGLSDGEADGEVEADQIPAPDDDSQQAAEAMMQLGNLAYYQQDVHDEGQGHIPQDQGNVSSTIIHILQIHTHLGMSYLA